MVNTKRSNGGELTWCQAIGKVLFPAREWGAKKSDTPPLAGTRVSKEKESSPCAQSPIAVEDENAAFSAVEEEKREIEAPEQEADEFSENEY